MQLKQDVRRIMALFDSEIQMNFSFGWRLKVFKAKPVQAVSRAKGKWPASLPQFQIGAQRANDEMKKHEPFEDYFLQNDPPTSLLDIELYRVPQNF